MVMEELNYGSQHPPFGQPQHPPLGQPQPQHPPLGQPQHPPLGQPQHPPLGQPQHPPLGQPQHPPLGQPQHPALGAPQHPPLGQPSANPATTSTGSSISHPSPQPTNAMSQQHARQLGFNYRLSRTAAEVLQELDFVPQCSYKLMAPRQYPSYEVSIWSDIGNRRTQEDRSVFCPQLIRRRSDTGFFGVFDGTVGDFASENIKLLVVPHLIGSPAWPRIVELIEAAERQGLRRGSTQPGEDSTSSRSSEQSPKSSPCQSAVDGPGGTGGSSGPRTNSDGPSPPTDKPPSEDLLADGPKARRTAAMHSDKDSPGAYMNPVQSDQSSPPSSACTSLPILTESLLDIELPPLISSAMDWMYLNSDTELVQLCAKHEKHYSSCTSVTVLILAGYCCIGHLGDSRVALGYQRMGMLYGEFLTLDHKPNMPSEQDRILRSGGSVEYLHNHNNKPFIRGGDFTLRKARGEQPMQLQYSRAFGGKDLKMFGLSNEPDLRVFKIDGRHHVLILASDGIWDVQSAANAVEIVLGAKRRGEHPALTLITVTLQEQRIKNQNADNVTAIVIFLEHGKVESKFKASSSGASQETTTKTECSSSRDAPPYNVYPCTPPKEDPMHQSPYNCNHDFH